MKKSYRRPDKKAPRYRKNTLRILNRDFYVRLHKKHPDLNLCVKDIKNIIDTFHNLCKDIIAETRDGLELPEQLGYMVLGKSKVKEFYSKDVEASFKYEMPIDFKNWDSNGWLCKIFYTNYAAKYRFRNAHLWAFHAGRDLKKKVSNAFKKDFNKYIVYDNHNKISQIYRKANKILKEKLKSKIENSE